MYKVYEPLKPEECLEYLRKSRSDDPLLTVEEVLAIGDQNNDIEMVVTAKYGVAMGNGTEQIKAADINKNDRLSY